MTKKPVFSPKDNTGMGLKVAVIAAILILTIAVYWQATAFGFQMYHDDEHYVTLNEHVTGGVTLDNVIWAFTSSHAANWHPLTWISHMVDCQLYGSNAGMHHLTNILLHLVNILLLFVLLTRLTGSFWRSAVVAALFALHPLHVESVAWVSERKDVLSAFFLLLSMLAYHRYVGSRRPFDYVLTASLFTVGLLAKPMLVTLPILLLVIDRWPLGRSESWGRLIREKIPLFALAIGSCVATYFAQNAGGAVQSLGAYSIGERILTAGVAFAAYIWKMFWPLRLAALYPHPVGGWPTWQLVTSGGFIVAMTALAVVIRRTKPYIASGWLWYIVSLIPVIGLVQVGEQAYADRYTYIPLIGVFVAIVWAVPEAWIQNRTKVLLPISAIILVTLSVLSFAQVKVWKDSETLFLHAMAAVPNNYLAEHELGMGYANDNRFAEAIPHIRKALELKPKWTVARFNLACALYVTGDPVAAKRELDRAVSDGFDLDIPGVKDWINTINSGAAK